ncbi:MULTISPECIES: ABC transporter ATP-binding protein [unclassified Petrotoga]|uniref:ABC transporter ATP-binding protein n=1 Tax=unclassified Petrotoga TaxID=2620614 RepID=UPI0018F2B7F4|nr:MULTISPECIES: ABC transporter ATP-binding protein [unclassified Petrotoga]
MIKIENLSVNYETKTGVIEALKDVNLELKKSEFLCILGPSGCGKSTLLRVIAGFIPLTSGKCLMHENPIEGPDWHRGVVFQSPTLYPWLTVKGNIEFGPKSRGVAKDKIEEISKFFIQEVDLTGFEEKYPFELSGGMKQRVALARVLANYPEVILMDEPFGSLDAFTRSNMQNLIRNIWQENNCSIFFITHDVDEALMLGTKVLVMSPRPGKIIKEFTLDFTYKLLTQKAKDILHTEEYFNTKSEILDLINFQSVI